MHYVLVHGMCHGAWCWYKVKPLLESAGHTVTPLDMGASGINTRPLEELRRFSDYNEPLLSFMAALQDDKVILVGHSLGGLNIAFAMEEFPHKISAAVFVSSFLPDTIHSPSYAMDELLSKLVDSNLWLDGKHSSLGSPEDPLDVTCFGDKFMSVLYESSPVEDYELAKMLVRPLPNYTSDIGKAEKLTEERFGSVPRIYVMCKGDKVISEEFVKKMIESSGINQVIELHDTDHMPMMSAPQQLSNCLLQIPTPFI